MVAECETRAEVWAMRLDETKGELTEGLEGEKCMPQSDVIALPIKLLVKKW